MSKLTKDAFAIMAICPSHQQSVYGIVVDYLSNKNNIGSNQLIFKWAFPISQKQAKKEGLDRLNISGTISYDKSYNGCPYCGQTGFYQCGKCGSIICWDGHPRIQCPNCGNQGLVETTDSFDLNGGSM